MRSRFHVYAWTALGTVLLGISIYLLINPARTGVVPNYRLAAGHWWEGISMYPGGTHGFLYAPPFAVLFSPLHFLKPGVLGEILWRGLGFSLFGFGLWILSLGEGRPLSAKGTASFGKRSLPNTNSIFLLLVLLAVPASLASLSNGQTNLPLSACLVLSALAIRDQKWKISGMWLTLALILKPIALAPWLLAFAVFPALRVPLLLGISVVLLLGFMHPSLAYAWSQWVEFFVKLTHSYTPENLRVSDIFGAAGKAGIEPPRLVEKGIRAGACLGAFAWLWHSYRHYGLPRACWVFWVASALVFTIFNPRAETNSYVLISPLLAYAAVSYWREAEGGRWKGVILAAACIGLMCDGMGKPIYLATDVWFKPLVVLLVSPLLICIPEGWKGNRGTGERPRI